MLTSVYFSPASNVNKIRQVIGQNNELLQFFAEPFKFWRNIADSLPMNNCFKFAISLCITEWQCLFLKKMTQQVATILSFFAPHLFQRAVKKATRVQALLVYCGYGRTVWKSFETVAHTTSEKVTNKKIKKQSQNTRVLHSYCSEAGDHKTEILEKLTQKSDTGSTSSLLVVQENCRLVTVSLYAVLSSCLCGHLTETQLRQSCQHQLAAREVRRGQVNIPSTPAHLHSLDQRSCHTAAEQMGDQSEIVMPDDDCWTLQHHHCPRQLLKLAPYCTSQLNPRYLYKCHQSHHNSIR